MKAMLAMGSLRGQLLRWLLLPLVLLEIINTISVYYNAVDAADMAYDRSLLASTRALAERVSVESGKVVVDVPYVALDSFETDTLGRIYYKVTGIKGETVSGYDDLPAVPANVPRSENYPALVRFYHANYNGQPIRIAALLQPVYDDNMRGIALIQVGETLDARKGLTLKILYDTIAWQSSVVLLAGLLVWFAVKLVLRPLMRLKHEVESRDVSDLSDLDPALVHKEVRPLVQAMNASTTRIAGLIASQRRFIADASHQLRTPLTVLKTQAELAQRELERAASASPELRNVVASMAATTDSTVHLANRLLMLARIEHGENREPVPVPMRETVQQVALELALSAVNRGIDLSLEGEGEASVNGQALLLHELVSNLVDNALHYTPRGGSVVLRVMHGEAQVVLEVEDSGPGIPPEDRDRVFSPFYRAASTMQANPGGSGLGLAIVRDIAVLHHAGLELDQGAGGRGLLVRVRFPRATPPPAA
ncbi:two-component system, OmpR family, sensor histidine kinase TctE [Duganella sp. CF458]|uniref:sensor histidine kinase n=1 Tax=Duganella sp. CF458 TaxID=1884368 RepID=UPI0008E63067|nr:sensor histidine kinase [Duganella sp. CF458]SFG26274.1 two-component system, OmpR family, sensor histidine kinase TctE [Duganella sp. CF458]